VIENNKKSNKMDSYMLKLSHTNPDHRECQSDKTKVVQISTHTPIDNTYIRSTSKEYNNLPKNYPRTTACILILIKNKTQLNKSIQTGLHKMVITQTTTRLNPQNGRILAYAEIDQSEAIYAS